MNPAPPQSPTFMSFVGTWLVDRVNVFFRVRRYLKMVAKRWVILAATTVLGTGYASYLAVTSPDIYSATSKIGIAPKVFTPGLSQSEVREELNSFYERNLDILNSSRLGERVTERMKPVRPAAQPFILNRMSYKGPGSFTLAVESTDPNYARAYAKAWAQEFIKFKSEDRFSTVESKAATTRDEIQLFEKKLADARDRLQTFRERHKIGSFQDTGDAAQQQLANLQADYQAIKTKRQRLENKTAEEMIVNPESEPLRTGPEKSGAPSRNEPPDRSQSLMAFEDGTDFNDLKFQLRTKEAEFERQQRILKPKHYHYVKLEDEIKQIRERMKIRLDLAEERRLSEIESLRKDERSYEPIIAELRDKVLSSRNLQYEYTALQEEEKNVKVHLDVLRRSEQSLSASTSDEGMLMILEEGIGAERPVRPNRRNMVLAGLALGIGIGLGIIYLLGRLDDRVELADDIETGLEQEVLGQIPFLDRSQIPDGNVLITRLDQHNMFAESIRHVRSAVMFGGREGLKQVLLITSAIPGDGKTTVTVNFAITLAIAGHNVLLVDGDLRRGNIHSFFGHPREPGFSEVLLGQAHWSDVARETEIPTLHYLPSGKLPANPGELLISPITQQFIDEARKSFDYVIFDCPPLTAIDDTFALVGQVDGLIFVVRSGHTSLRFARNALEAVQQRGAKILGVVLNGITADNPYYYYRNYYHAYYSKTEGRPVPVAPDQIPAVKMAAPKNRRHKFSSIELAAKRLAGESVSPEQLAAESESKTARYRRKPAQKTKDLGSHGGDGGFEAVS